jgi:hypothetical protein
VNPIPLRLLKEFLNLSKYLRLEIIDLPPLYLSPD